MSKKTNITFDPYKPECPCCNDKMVVNPAEKGILNEGGMYLIPLICLKCNMELWVRALPCGVICDEKFSERLEGKSA